MAPKRHPVHFGAGTFADNKVSRHSLLTSSILQMTGGQGGNAISLVWPDHWWGRVGIPCPPRGGGDGSNVRAPRRVKVSGSSSTAPSEGKVTFNVLTISSSYRTTSSDFCLLKFTFSSTTNSCSSGAAWLSSYRSPGIWRTCSRRKKLASQASKVVAKAQYACDKEAECMIGTLEVGLKGIVFLYFPCPQIRMQFSSLLSICVPLGNG
jgi:hypothetical protein